MMRNRVFRYPLLPVAVLACVLAAAMPAAPIRIATANFELFTEEAEPVARQFVLHLERVRAYFEQHGGALKPPPGPVRIVGFRSLEEYRSNGPEGFASAHYQNAPERESIVVSSLASDSYRAAVHEYVHLLVRRAGWSLPLWLSEGVAEFYSTLQPLPNGEFRVGDPPPAHPWTLKQNPWLDLEVLFGVDRLSPYYTDPRLAPLFYAESWALTHMLAFPDSGRPDFLSLADSASRREPAGLRKELEVYLAKDPSPSGATVYSGPQSLPEPSVRPVGDLEWGLVLAEQLAGTANDLEMVEKVYEDLGSRYPGNWEPAAALARLALGRGRLMQARRLFARAVELGATDVELYLEYAELQDGDPGRRTEVLRGALQLRPGDAEIQRRLALALYDALDFQGAREWMLKIGKPPEERAPEFYRVLAYINDRLGFVAEARSAARRAVEVARTNGEAESARQMLDFITRPAAPIPQVVINSPPAEEPQETLEDVRPAEPPSQPTKPLYAVRGELVQFDCLGMNARIVVRTRTEKLAFGVPYPRGLVILRGGSPVLRFLPCGPLKPSPVLVRYEMRRESYLGTVGVVRVLEYR